jgi:hypothetical protein
MPKRTSSYRAWQRERLSDPKVAANYLNAALADSPDGFLTALGKVVVVGLRMFVAPAGAGKR